MPERPKVGVGLFVMGGDGTFVVIERKGSHGEGTWALVGGHVEFGQSPQEAAAAEAREEMGLDLDPASIHVGPWTNDVFHDEGKHYLTLFAWVELPHGQWPAIREPDKISRWRWAAFDDVPRPVFLPLGNLLATGWRPPLGDARPLEVHVVGHAGYQEGGYSHGDDVAIVVARDPDEARRLSGREREPVAVHPLTIPVLLATVPEDHALDE